MYFDSDRRFELCRIRDIQVRDIEIRLLFHSNSSRKGNADYLGDYMGKNCVYSNSKWDRILVH